MLLNKTKTGAMLLTLATALCAGNALTAQDWHGGDNGRGAGGDSGGGPGMARSFHGMERGRWWDNPRLTQQIGITDDQKKKMDDIFQQHKLKLIDLNAALEKQEAIMHPLIEADQQDEGKILAQIDAIAQARAELEKDRARMLFSIRQTLTPEQWKKLQTVAHQGPPPMDGGRGSADGHGRSWGRGGSSNGPGGPDGAAPKGGPQSGQPGGPPPSAPQGAGDTE